MTWLSTLLTLALAGNSIAWRLPSAYTDEKAGLHERRDDELTNSLHGRSGLPNPLLSKRSVISAANYTTCPAPVELSGKAPKKNVWAGLTNEEASGLLTWLHAPAQGLNLTVYENKTLWDNYVGVIEQIMPNKTDALSYIDGCGELPTKYARVVINFGATEEPYTEDFMVGPIPVTPETTIQPMIFPYNKGTSKQRNPRHDNGPRGKWKNKLMGEIQDITLDLLGTYINETDGTSSLQSIDPIWEENGRIIEWSQWRLNYQGLQTVSTMVPQGLYVKFDITGRDENSWKLLGILYNNIFYETLADFRAAWEKPDFERLPKTEVGQYAMLNQTGEAMPYDLEPPPIQVQTQKRWTVDREEKYVKWMDFTFYYGFSKDVGLTLFDITYKGERIIYELGLQEALAHYAGVDPKSSGTAFLDTYYGFGNYYFSLVKGYDCPLTADYVDTSLHENGNTITHEGSLCFFEMDAGFPIQRHTTSKLTQVTKNIIFVLRGVSTIGNYDYTFDYVFHYDGSIEVKVRASGYIQSTHYAHNSDYGYKIENHLSGSMHDHVLTFKADLDIKGTANSFETTTIYQTKEKYPWANEERTTMKLKRKIAQTEDEGFINYAPNGVDMFNVVNTDKPNKWGEYPGYRIMPGAGTPIHTTVTDSSIVKKTGFYSTKHMFVTKHKDTEPRASHPSDSLDGNNPVIDFSKFFDGEKIAQEDIVVWFNLGMHHVPHTGDLPNTVQTTAQSSVVFAPHNYLLGDPTRATAQMVDIDTRGDVPVVESYGKKNQACAAPVIVEPSYAGYKGSIEVSKMNYEHCAFC